MGQATAIVVFGGLIAISIAGNMSSYIRWDIYVWIIDLGDSSKICVSAKLFHEGMESEEPR
jgi:hypothetical protein